jgi:tRNA(Ile)-lysidine synthase
VSHVLHPTGEHGGAGNAPVDGRAAERLAESLRRHLGPEAEARPIGLAVSGGSDSMALLAMAGELAGERGLTVEVATVDHGLRAEAAQEARLVELECKKLGLPHVVLHGGPDALPGSGPGNLMAAARRLRYGLLAGWARRQALAAVLLAHTADDLAETFLMRLRRKPGLDGLAAMPARFEREGAVFLRPLLEERRTALQALLRERGVPWADDPSNADPRFERSRARAALPELGRHGLTVEVLAAAARNLAEARDLLDAEAARFAAGHVEISPAGAITMARAAFEAAQPAVQRRLLGAALRFVAGPDADPRGDAVDRALPARLQPLGRTTLAGCDVQLSRDRFTVSREFAAVAGLRAAPSEPWDGRWRLRGPNATEEAGIEIRALGADGLAVCGNRSGLPARDLHATPAAWRGAELVAAPLAGVAGGWRAELLRARAAFLSSLGAH